MFIDNARISVRAGNGGNGCASYYQDKYNMRGFPDGGDGGRGADVVIIADRNLRTLMDFQYNRHFTGKHGGHGSSKNAKGKDAAPVMIRVPCGTIIKDEGIDCILGSLDTDREELIVAFGGKGGRGNRKNREATQGEPGDAKGLILDLKLIADVGLVGFPNAGKSTLISSISHATPAIAAYPFTTKTPVLGMVNYQDETFVIADIPGLIEGSAQGKGLGDRFLRHVERTKILVHIIDMSGFEGRDPIEDYRTINRELDSYSPDVAKKPQIVVANKMDLPGSKANLARFKKTFRKKVYPVSALEKQGLEELIDAIGKKL
ncbi:MAG: GTPase ObgE [Candidatus Omnitrophica bacterium]|jgi:GTP-binding protein|nr:GTPase ObgE [Candidatus Omnitrophota bacterium]MDD5080291.1 GTPase ObgE [Candidatus Omnitrophota bacterium]